MNKEIQKMKLELIEEMYEKLYELDPASEEYQRVLENIKRLEGPNKRKEVFQMCLDGGKVALPVIVGAYFLSKLLDLEYKENGMIRSSIGKTMLSLVKFW